MRFNLKVLVCLVIAVTLFMIFNFWTKCNDITKQDNNFYRETSSHHAVDHEEAKPLPGRLRPLHQSEPINYEELECLINDEYTVTGRREGQEVYLPFFGFIAKYFEVYGAIREYDGYERFEWRHAYSKVYTPPGRYSPEGIFMSFEHYNVEVRDRVKCISGMEGVPISTQWGAHGYFYPIQIAQYGLSHYSKYLTEKSRSVHVFEDAEDEDEGRWKVPDEKTFVKNVVDPVTKSRVIEFTSTDDLSHPGVALKIGQTSDMTLSLDYKFVSNGSITVLIETKGKHPNYYLHYVRSKTLIMMEGNEIFYGIGEHKQWTRITRDLVIDLHKGLALKFSKKKAKAKAIVHGIKSIHLRGQGFVDNVTLSNNAHLAQFYYAANWLVVHQDSQGGWPIMVTRRLANGMLELPPGWYSAMAQGQAMSLLTRAYVRTRNRKYLESALRATKLFEVASSQGGILARFVDKYPWYEEYPTTPSCYVLNGFIYSLIGLYDLKMVAPKSHAKHAEVLYETGIDSLKAMLPFFDTGSGTIYDLRHFTLGVAPNLARWDYHTTHINQLLLLSTIEDDPIFETTAARWKGYMKGKRAPHN